MSKALAYSNTQHSNKRGSITVNILSNEMQQSEVSTIIVCVMDRVDACGVDESLWSDLICSPLH